MNRWSKLLKKNTSKHVEKKFKDVEKKLKECRRELEYPRETAKSSKPWCMEPLFELFKGIGIDERKVKEALCDLIVDIPQISPILDCIETYIIWKDRVNFKNVDNAIEALVKLTAIENVREQENVLQRIGLRILPYYLLYSEEMLRGAASLALLGNFSSEILLRGAIETSLKGILFEHLLRKYFRNDVKRMLQLEKRKRYDSVTIFMEISEELSEDLKVPLEEVIKYPNKVYEEMYREMKARLNIYDILFWLVRWNVFRPIPDAKEKITKLYKDLSEEIHGNIEKLTYSITRKLFLNTFPTIITNIVDLTIVAVLNTVDNVLDIKAKAKAISYLESIVKKLPQPIIIE